MGRAVGDMDQLTAAGSGEGEGGGGSRGLWGLGLKHQAFEPARHQTAPVLSGPASSASSMSSSSSMSSLAVKATSTSGRSIAR
jgi:hypothetical protein